MILDHVDRLRKCLDESTSWPLSYDKWPDELNAKTNCLAFQLGLNIDLGTNYRDFGKILNPDDIYTTSSLTTNYEHILTELGLDWRKLSRLDDATADEYIFQIHGPFHLHCDPYYDFHAVRRELNGIWVHKPSFGMFPEIIEWKCLSILYPRSTIAGTYAVKKKTP